MIIKYKYKILYMNINYVLKLNKDYEWSQLDNKY